jgi:NAD(P)H-dependent FMN reductase
MSYTIGYFVGSLSSTSINRTLANALISLAPEQLEFREIPIGGLPLYSPDHDADYPAEARALKAAIEGSDGILFVSPEYNRSIPGALKNAIDWASSPVAGDPVWSDGTLPFRGKVVGMASASPGGLGGLRAQSHLAPLLLNLQCWLAPLSHAVGLAGQAFDEAGRLQRPADQQGMKALLEQLAWAAHRLVP